MTRTNLTNTDRYNFISLGDRDIPLDIKRNSRAKRCILRVNHIKQSIDITIPKRYKTEKAIKFARSQIHWIRKQINNTPKRVSIADGITLSIAGIPTIITRSEQCQRGVKKEKGKVILSGLPEHFNRRAKDYLKKEAKQIFTPIAHEMATKLGKRINRISVRDTFSRWGSCNSVGNISFSWRLVLAPQNVMEYVIAHEVAHLVELNHSDAFWAKVRSLTPNYHTAKKWLQENGNSLHLYD